MMTMGFTATLGRGCLGFIKCFLKCRRCPHRRIARWTKIAGEGTGGTKKVEAGRGGRPASELLSRLRVSRVLFPPWGLAPFGGGDHFSGARVAARLGEPVARLP